MTEQTILRCSQSWHFRSCYSGVCGRITCFKRSGFKHGLKCPADRTFVFPGFRFSKRFLVVINRAVNFMVQPKLALSELLFGRICTDHMLQAFVKRNYRLECPVN